jgi:hypothetical protein
MFRNLRNLLFTTAMASLLVAEGQAQELEPGLVHLEIEEMDGP